MDEALALAVDPERHERRAEDRRCRQTALGFSPPPPPADRVLALDRMHFRVKGMVSRLEAVALERRLARMPGVDRVTVTFATETVTVGVLDGRSDAAAIAYAVRNAGFSAYPIDSAESTPEEAREREYRRRRRSMLVTVVPTLVVLGISIGIRELGLGGAFVRSALVESQLYLSLLIFVAGFGLGADAARQFGLRALAREAPLGAVAAVALFGSLWAFFTQGEPMFELGPSIVAGYHAGMWLEKWLERQATRHYRRLIALRPRHAIVRRGSRDVRIGISDLTLQDVVVVRPGERIPVDGLLAAGGGVVDESELMGAGAVSQKAVGDRVFAGSRADCALDVTPEEIGDATVLGHLLRVVEAAREVRAPVQRRGDRLAALVSPVAPLLAIGTLLAWHVHGVDAFWEALGPALGVLVLTTPWAIGVASAVSVTAAMTHAARLGVLIRDAAVVEQIYDLDVMVFEKAGTLTVDRPEVESFERFGEYDQAAVLRMMVALERQSSHATADAFVRFAREHTVGLDDASLPPVRGFRTISGRGVIGRIDGREVLVGTSGLLAEKDIPFPPEPEPGVPGAFYYVAIDGVVHGRALLYDPLRSDSVSTVALLRRTHVRPMLVTSGSTQSALKVARTVGIEGHDVRSGIDTAEHAQVVRVMRAAGFSVGVAGNSDSDQVSLAAADVAFALIPHGVLPEERYPVVLLRPGSGGIIHAVQVARRAFRVMRQNVAIGALAMLAAVPAGLGFFPSTAAVLGLLASVLVVGLNGLRIRS